VACFISASIGVHIFGSRTLKNLFAPIAQGGSICHSTRELRRNLSIFLKRHLRLQLTSFKQIKALSNPGAKRNWRLAEQRPLYGEVLDWGPQVPASGLFC